VTAKTGLDRPFASELHLGEEEVLREWREAVAQPSAAISGLSGVAALPV
jgi:hypothetical protein